MGTDILINSQGTGLFLFSNQIEQERMWIAASECNGFLLAKEENLCSISECFVIIHADLRYELKQENLDYLILKILLLKKKGIISRIIFSCTMGENCAELNQKNWIYAENEIKFLLQKGTSFCAGQYVKLEETKRILLAEKFIWLFFWEMESERSKSCKISDTNDVSDILQIILKQKGLNGYYNALAHKGICSNEKSFFDMTSLLYASQKEELVRQADIMNGKIIHNKIRKIQLLEKKILLYVDEVCKKYNISYFLAGGSLLGAVRHQGFIPWDDDLDIGMLRDDFEKFRKICPKELSDEFIYQSWTKKDGSHYQFDKIRLRGTRLETKFSSQFKMENGIFLDILVYDKTSNSKALQHIHIKMLTWFAHLLRVRWFNYPRRGKMYYLSLIILPALRLFSIDFFNKLFERIMKLFSTKQGIYLVDSAGQNVEKGAFPEKWLKTVEIGKFENSNISVPIGAQEYLSHFYGNNYMEIPAVDKQTSGHVWKKIDLGHYVEMNE